ncbi:hypothetical protein FB451DRAFT_1410440 [Mycena latifolia]|nr:hypothetical protein FB451DRAFT_1410440 [Mycena latifolia]
MSHQSCDVTRRVCPSASSFAFPSSAASCPLGRATESFVLARACGVPVVLTRVLYELVRRPAYGQPEREGVSAHDFRPREELTAVWMLTMLSYSPDLALCASAGKGGAAPARCTMLATRLDGFCAACVALRREVWVDRREKMWDNLDIWFGLDA